jgi:predicted anti-sigma-YlaC factor YlaD
MRCVDAAYYLQLYVDYRLTMEQMRMLEAHIVRCASCRAEMALLEEVAQDIHNLKLVAEPEDLTARIMQRVAMTSPRHSKSQFSPLRLSLPELLAAILLATIATLGSILAQPSVRTLLPFANGHDSLSLAFSIVLHILATINISTLIGACWVVGTILGICITLVLAGNEVRAGWLKAVMERLPVR